MSIENDLEAYKKRLAARGVRIVYKSSSYFWKFLDLVVRIATLGRNKTFLDHYTTTIGHTIALPAEWDQRDPLSQLATLVHEAVHVEQFERYTPILMGLAYLFLPLPVLFAWCRYRLELEAYAKGYKVLLAVHPAHKNYLIEHFVQTMGGSGYAWTWVWKSKARRDMTAALDGF